MLADAKSTAMALNVISFNILLFVIRDSLLSHAEACKENFLGYVVEVR